MQLRRIPRDEWLLAMARLVSARSTCSRAQVGCVIARDNRVLTLGYNGAPAGHPHCDHTCTCVSAHEPGCPQDRRCEVSVHAEANAIAYSARWGIPLEDTSLYCMVSPCLTCAQLIINTGISRVVYAQAYRKTEGVELMREAGLTLEHLQL